MKILHIADLHYSPAHADKALASLRVVREAAAEGADVVVVGGDMFDRAVYNSDGGRLPELIDMWASIDRECAIVGVTGTPTHDVAGSYHPIVHICDFHGFTLLEPGAAYALFEGGTVHEIGPDYQDWLGKPRLLILGCPEPSKERWLRDKKGLGREEANQAVVDGMRQLLLGLGGIRKQHPDLPCIFVYHGQVAGASLANGQQLRPGGIQIGREDLALVGADYCALGDIHLAQQIGDLPAYYPGSCFPVNWGELDQKGFNVVEIRRADEVYPDLPDDTPGASRDAVPRFPVSIDRIPFPHPPRRKIVFGVGQPIPEDDFDGQDVWFVAKGTSEEMVRWEPELSEFEQTLPPNCRFTREVIHTETVRAGEIQEARSLRDKVQLWAENTGAQVPDEVLDLADAVEEYGRTQGVTAGGLHIRIDRLILRGAIGTWKGLGVEDVDLDLASMDPGLVALIGANGKGKTTILENMHPFPTMLTRGGKLQDHFRLRDSCRDLYFTDERTGDEYRALITIDGHTLSGACEYHLYRNGTPLVNGRKADYEAKIAELFGSLSLFLRSAFSSQKATRGNPDLADASKGEKKALFRELGGLDYLQWYADHAKALAQGIEGQIVADEREIEVLERDTARLEEMRGDLGHAEGNLQQMRIALKTIEDQGRARKDELDRATERLTAHRQILDKIEDDRRTQARVSQQTGLLETERNSLTALHKGRDALRNEIDRTEDLQREEAQLNDAKTKVLEDRERIRSEHADRVDALRKTRSGIEAKRREIAQEVADFRKNRAVLQKEIDRLDERLQHQVECPECHTHFVVGGDLDRKNLAEAQERAFALDQDITKLDRDDEELDGRLADLVEPPAPELPAFEDEDRLTEIRLDLSLLDITQLRRDLDVAQGADARFSEIDRRLEELEQEKQNTAARITELMNKRDPAAEEAHTKAERAYESARSSYADAKAAVSRAEAEVEALQNQVREIESKLDQLAKLRKTIDGRKAEASNLRWMEKACGPDGIQALELDAMGPGIADVANRILGAAYGTRFRIEFRTTRMAGSGSQMRQVEDFQIYVHDTEAGTEQPMDTLSGGESVWIKRAIYDACGIVRDRQTGQRFLTVFLDEADGALDPEARVAYARMLEAAHEESGRRHTILITHSSEVQEIIEQRIRMEELAREVVST